MLCLWNSSELYERERKSAPAVMRFQKRTDWKKIYYRFHIL